MEVTVRDLKSKLSEYLHRAEAGEEVVITSRGRPVARLGPVTQPASSEEEALIQRLRSVPWLRPGKESGPDDCGNPVELPPGVSLADAVLEDRN